MGGPTLTILGCGNLGTAILKGILNSDPQPSDPSFTAPSKFIACVHRESSAQRVASELGKLTSINDVTILCNDNLKGVTSADVVLLACEPRGLADVLTRDVCRSLGSKLLISILAGVTADQISAHIATQLNSSSSKCVIARVLPNTSAAIGLSMTACATDTPGLSGSDPTATAHRATVRWIFKSVGEVVEVPTRLMDVSTALSGSGVAFAALMLESLAQGGVAMGLAPRDAQVMAAQVMKGTAQQVLDGNHPAVLRDKVTTPGGCTIAGLCVMEEGGVRGAVSKAIREATTVVGLLGRGVNQPNRTRLD